MQCCKKIFIVSIAVICISYIGIAESSDNEGLIENCNIFSQEDFQGTELANMKSSDSIFDYKLISDPEPLNVLNKSTLVKSVQLKKGCAILICDLSKLKGNCDEYLTSAENLTQPLTIGSAVCSCSSPQETTTMPECAKLYKEWSFNGRSQKVEFVGSAGRIDLGYSRIWSAEVKPECSLNLWKNSVNENKVFSLQLNNSTSLLKLDDSGSYSWYCCHCDESSQKNCQSAMESSSRLQPVSSDDIAFSPSNSQDIPDFVRYGKKVIGIGRNYRWKNSELAKVLKVPDEPIVFMKPSTSYIVEGQDIELPKSLGTIFYEIELGVVIGKKGKSIKKSEVLDYVSGYFLTLDMTAKEFLKKSVNQSKPWEIGKGFDTACPVSHFIPKNLIPNPNDIYLECKVNGNVTQSANTNEMIFDVPTLIAYISKYMTLEPYDVILTGTPDGLGPLHDGDVIEGRLGNITTIRFDSITVED